MSGGSDWLVREEALTPAAAEETEGLFFPGRRADPSVARRGRAPDAWQERSTAIGRLTGRQRDCLRLVRQGYTSKEIGRRLAISPATVDNHVRAALALLQVPGRAEAARMLRQHEHDQALTNQPSSLAARATGSGIGGSGLVQAFWSAGGVSAPVAARRACGPHAPARQASTRAPIPGSADAANHDEGRPWGHGEQALASAARHYLKQRRRRDALFPKCHFADPAWDLLLDLYVAGVEGRPVPVSSACIAAAVAASTALRWIGVLEKAGLVRRIADRQDGRRAFLTLSPLASERVAIWLRTTFPVPEVRQDSGDRGEADAVAAPDR